MITERQLYRAPIDGLRRLAAYLGADDAWELDYLDLVIEVKLRLREKGDLG